MDTEQLNQSNTFQMSSDQFLDIAEAAEFLKVKKATVYSWIHKQSIPYRKHGSRVVFFREDLMAWSESKKISPKSFLGERRRRLRNIQR